MASAPSTCQLTTLPRATLGSDLGFLTHRGGCPGKQIRDGGFCTWDGKPEQGQQEEVTLPVPIGCPLYKVPKVREQCCPTQPPTEEVHI